MKLKMMGVQCVTFLSGIHYFDLTSDSEVREFGTMSQALISWSTKAFMNSKDI